MGVVVEMWEREEEEEEEGGGSEEEEEEKSESDLGGVEGEAEGRGDGREEKEGVGMWVRVKWFQRVREVPSMMHQRLGGVGDKVSLSVSLSLLPSFLRARFPSFS